MATTNYYAALPAVAKQNAAIVAKVAAQKGIKNALTIAAIMAVISKESKFIPQSEVSYKNTSNAQIRNIFKDLVSNLSEAQLTALKANDVAFFDKVYGGRYGNAPNEGYKYRGRGFNQITFKARYLSIGKKIGYDLVANPDLLNRVDVAAAAAIQYFIDEFETAKAKGYLTKFNTTDINGFRTLQDALNAVFQANRGWLKTGPDTTGGYAKAKERVDSLYEAVKENKEVVAAAGGGLFFLAALALAIAKRKSIINFFNGNKQNQPV